MMDLSGTVVLSAHRSAPHADPEEVIFHSPGRSRLRPGPWNHATSRPHRPSRVYPLASTWAGLIRTRHPGREIR